MSCDRTYEQFIRYAFGCRKNSKIFRLINKKGDFASLADAAVISSRIISQIKTAISFS